MVKRRNNQPDKVKGEKKKGKLEVTPGREELVNTVEVERVERETDLIENTEEEETKQEEEGTKLENEETNQEKEVKGEEENKDKEERTELRIKWEVGVLEVKLGLPPSHPKAAYYHKKLSLKSLFTPDELQDNGKEPSKRELKTKLEKLREELAKVKVEELVKFAQKEVKDAVRLETLRLLNKSKQLNNNKNQPGEKEKPSPDQDWTTELELTKSIDCHQFARTLLCMILKKNRLLADHPHLTSFLPGPPYSDAFPSPSHPLVTKLVQRLLSTKLLSNCSHRIKADLFTHLKLEVTPTSKQPDTTATPSEPPTGSDSITTDPPKSQSKSKSKKPVSDSLFVTSLGDFDEEDGEFKKIYGIKGKNRPGQRQRRKMTEEKYGTEARHLPPPPSKSKPNSKPKSATPTAPKRNATPLHPSWEAKRHQQQRISLTNPPKNQKIVFD